ncbi:hypothetical protein F441_21888 [Phytophthora nicotianae CJ01A1]|uniref:Uncharacterized protein n=2 Tax=Phytophthora nicotianae TaxID=4792 RepID=W2FN36_PHYNI|nr:hypothetical protein L915_21400 [Phytophthora nicotianae]ETL78010.1 hypothetical protein L917_21115 [Phytophthora nicotianae]ETP00762.1 hypothetical protein F441_21888 [Phytophthora nicotianae CJ01A1]
MKNTDVVEDMEEIAAESQSFDDLPDTTPFTFGYPLDEDGAPDLGDGSDAEPLVIGVTTNSYSKWPRGIPTHLSFIKTRRLSLKSEK